MKDLYFDGKVVKFAGDRLIITVPKSISHLFPAGTKVRVVKSK